MLGFYNAIPYFVANLHASRTRSRFKFSDISHTLIVSQFPAPIIPHSLITSSTRLRKVMHNRIGFIH